jgi:hypothetical protein
MLALILFTSQASRAMSSFVCSDPTRWLRNTMWSVCNGTAIFVRTNSGAAILKRRDNRRDLKFGSGDQRHAEDRTNS